MRPQDFLREKLDGKKWSMYTEDEQSLLWDEIEKYGTEKGLGLDEKKLKVVDTLLRKISRSRSKRAPSHTQLFLGVARLIQKHFYRIEPSAETPEARSSDTGVYDPVKNAWIERKDTE
jgi:hypothetical protein